MTIGIIGFGRFGQLLAKIMKPYAEVYVCNRLDQAVRAKELGVKWSSLKEVCQCDWVFVAVAISAIEEVLQKIAPLLKEGNLVMDVASVKVLPAKWLKKYLPKTTQIMATHPMFGPDSAKNGTAGLQWILCPLRIKSETLDAVKNILNDLELKIVTTTAKDHDQQSAVSLSMVHFIGRGLEEFGIERQKISSLGYERLLKVNETVTNDSWQLFVDMNTYNPFAKKVRKKLIKAFKIVNRKLK